MAVNVTAANFDELVMAAKVPVLVDFFAPWCGPCKMMSPYIEELAQELGEKALVCKVDADAESELANRFRVMAVPTLMLVKDGKIVRREEGAKDIDGLRGFFNKA